MAIHLTRAHTHTHKNSGFCKEILACLASNTNWVVCGVLCTIFWEVSHQRLILAHPGCMLKGLKAKLSVSQSISHVRMRDKKINVW